MDLHIIQSGEICSVIFFWIGNWLIFSRFGYIEIYKEKIFDLLNDRQPVSMDQNKKFDFMLSNTEIVAENFEKAARIMFDGSYKRKSSADDATKLSSLSHSIFRIVSVLRNSYIVRA